MKTGVQTERLWAEREELDKAHWIKLATNKKDNVEGKTPLRGRAITIMAGSAAVHHLRGGWRGAALLLLGVVCRLRILPPEAPRVGLHHSE